MSTTAESLFEEALRLPAADRARFASGLLASLDSEPTNEADVDRTWNEETERRSRMLELGQATLVTWEHLAEEVDSLRHRRSDD